MFDGLRIWSDTAWHTENPKLKWAVSKVNGSHDKKCRGKEEFSIFLPPNRLLVPYGLLSH